MNCEHCQNLISEFVGSDHTVSPEISAHLDVCEPCAGIYRDLNDLTQFCSSEYVEQEAAPPNSQALWCRISNIIESEIETAPPVVEAEKKKGFWAGVWQKNWQLSFSQMAAAIIGVAVVSSLLTIVGIKNSFRSANDLSAANGANTIAQPSLFETLLSKAGITPGPEELREKTFNDKQVVIDYWNARVAARRAQWNAKMRDTFDRNLHEIDQVVVEYSQNLKENPQDSLSEEMLNSALTEKMDLLREFSEL